MRLNLNNKRVSNKRIEKLKNILPINKKNFSLSLMDLNIK
jgi:hypothetical protein